MVDKWVAIAPIPQLFLDSDMKVDDFVIRKEITKESLKSEFGIDFDEEHFNYIERELWTSSSIYVRYFDAEESNFFNTAHTHFYHLLNILILFKPSKFYMPKRTLFVKRVKKMDGTSSTRDMTDDGRYPDLLLEIEDSEHIDFDSYFKICYQYFIKTPTNTIDKSILESARVWLGKARQTRSIYERIILLSIVQEALVEDRGPGLTERIQNRCASFLSNSSKDYDYILARVGKIYDLRSDLVHGEVLSPAKFSDTYELAEIVRCLLLQFISLSQFGYDRATVLAESNVTFAEKQSKKVFIDAKKIFGGRSDYNPLNP